MKKRPRRESPEESDMTISGWWLIPAFVVGAYGGVALMAAMYVAGRERERSDLLPEPSEPQLAALGAAWATAGQDLAGRETAGARKQRAQRRTRRAEPGEVQTRFQW
jgi:hypothetical protein